jgi:hypothetical protein
VLGPTKLAALRERVDLELTARNPARVPADAPVVLEVDLKNVAQLVVKTFRIDPVAYFLARGAEVDTAIDLDGMVASDEQIVRSEAPAIRRERRRIELPGCARPGTYVIELIGNGKSSRALLRKGGLRHSVRVGAAGPTVRVLDEAGAPLTGARVWLGGREYAPREDGAISIPFSTAPTRASMLLVHGEVAQLETLEHPAERYQFSAGLHLERESMIPGMTARLLLRPQLTLAGWPAPIALVDDPRIELTVTERGGTTSTKSQSVVLRDDAETVVELRIPEEAAAIAVAVRGTVRVASTQQTLDLVDEAHGVLGAIHRVSDTEALHLATTAEGHVLQLLGKTGEPRGGRAIALSFKHVAVNFEIALTLETDEHGRIELGALPGIQRLMAGLPSTQQSWWLWPEHEAPRALHVVAGAPIALPRPPGVPAEDPAAALALLELRGGAVSRDLAPLLRVLPHTLEIAGSLEPGDYLLRCRGVADVSIVVVPAAARGRRRLGRRRPALARALAARPRLTELVADADALRLRLADCGPATRVHLIATRFRPTRPPEDAAPLAPSAARRRGRAGALALCVGPRHRRRVPLRARSPGPPASPRRAARQAGPAAKPWALRTTSTGVQHARGGGAYGASGARSSVAPSPAVGRPQAQASGEQAAYAALDFMPAAAPVLANLRPDARGELEIPTRRPRRRAARPRDRRRPRAHQRRRPAAARDPAAPPATSGCASPSIPPATSARSAASRARAPAARSSSTTCAPASSSSSTPPPARIRCCSRSAPPIRCASSASSPSGTPSTMRPAGPATASTPATSSTCSCTSATPRSSRPWSAPTSPTSATAPSSTAGCSRRTSPSSASPGPSPASTRSSASCSPAGSPRSPPRSPACSATSST